MFVLTKRRGVERSDTDDKGYIYYFAGGANTCAFDNPASYLDWLEQGLGGISCELRLDKRYKGNALMLSYLFILRAKKIRFRKKADFFIICFSASHMSYSRGR